jgi:molybdopterin-guanine dinucleotide biosynthesis protein A
MRDPGQKEITAIILAGGKSSRMKADKGLVNFKGRMLVEYVIDAAQQLTSNIIIITQNPVYEKLGYPCYTDIHIEKGALGGIYTGLVKSQTQKNLVVGCDMPFLAKNVLAGMIDNCDGVDALIAMHRGKEEPLCSIYDKSCIPHFRQRIEQDQLKITDALAGLKTRVISFDNEEWFRGNEFANINSIEELNKYK